MGNPREIHGSVPATKQQRSRRRDDVIKDITLALAQTIGVALDAGQRGGFDPYDSRLGTTRNGAWKQRRPA
ncbi:MAG TPA: hypothetical protein VGF89_13910 [Steroidobacteraceae bacterium]|jgi:hypothetical protein